MTDNGGKMATNFEVGVLLLNNPNEEGVKVKFSALEGRGSTPSRHPCCESNRFCRRLHIHFIKSSIYFPDF